MKSIFFSFKVEYECNKQQCDDCDINEECKCNGLKSILLPEKYCVLCDTSNGFYFDGKFCYRCSKGCSSCKSILENDCNSCQKGYFIQNKKCLPCNSVCETCDGPNNNSCLKCKSPKVISTEKKECSDDCKSNEYSNGIQCFNCPKKCTECKNENLCTACSKGYFLRGGLCVEKCGTNEFINEKNECKLCNQSCKTCSGSSDINCTSCANNDQYIHEENNKCQTCDTQNGYYISGNKCLKCFPGCLTCIGSTQGMCETCKTSFYFDKVNQTCNQCHPECSECSGIQQNQCIKCKQSDSYISLQDNICRLCNKNEYNDGTRCQLCSKECLTCLKYDQCTSCSDNLYFRVQEQKCVLECNDNEFVNEKKQCQKCDQSCKTCFGPNQNDCKLCSGDSQYVSLSNNLCEVCDTYNGYFINLEKKCEKCSQDCLQCQGSGKTDCKVCSNQFYLNPIDKLCTQCHNDCDGCQSGQNNQCNKCKDKNKFISTDDKTCKACNKNEYNDSIKCISCKPECQSCLDQNTCFDCNQPFHFRRDTKNCVKSCNENEFVNSKNECQICDSQCKSCNGELSTNCIECKNQNEYVQDFNQNICGSCDIKNGYYLKNSTCYKCYENCKQCTGSQEIDCQICSNGFFLSQSDNKCIPCHADCKICTGPENNQCIQCSQSSFFVNKDNNICQECEDLNKCSICKQGYYLRPKSSECVQSCNSDEFIDEIQKQCKQCDLSCKTCIGELKTNCSSCSDSSLFILEYSSKLCGLCDIQNGYYINDNKCLKCSDENCKFCNGLKDSNLCSECQDNYFLDDSTKECNKCHDDCNGCTGEGQNQCKKCKNDKYLKQNICQYCEDNEYHDSTYCKTCPPQCSSCLNEHECKKCSDNFVFREDDKTCTCQLENGYFILDNKCIKCADNCKVCTGPQPSQCSTCNDQFYYEKSTNQCKECHNECNGCSGSTKYDCLKCSVENKYKSSTDKSCQECQQNEYIFEKTSCKKCPDQCKQCNNATQCTSCAEKYFFQKEKMDCVNNCNNNQFSNDNKECINCDKTCTSCTGPLKTDCTACSKPDQYIQKFKNENQCGECDIKNGLFIQGSECLKCNQTCKQCSGPSEIECQVCGEQYYYDKKTKTCKECHSDCNGCNGPDRKDCKRCSENGKYLSTQDDTCQICQPSEYNDKTRCILCPQQCSSCKNEKICTGCSPNFFFRPEEGICAEECHSEEYISDDKKCIKCHEQCKTCDGNSEFNCLSCSDSKKFITSKDNKCGACESDEFENLETNKCQKCHQDCLTCSGPNKEDCMSCSDKSKYQCSVKNECEKSCLKCHEGCNSCFGEQSNQCKGCSVGILQDDGSCQKKCPLYYFYKEETNSCEICIDYCKSCDNSTSCIECDLADPFIFMYEKKCYNCSKNQFFDKEKSQCIDCNSSCNQCSSLETCLSCNDLEFLHEGKCFKQCPDSFIGDSTQGKCIPCKYQNGTCVLNCSNPFYQEGNQCLQCSENCSNCVSKDICKECTNNSAIKESGQISYCQQCENNEFVFNLKQCKKCIDAIPQCQQCSDQGYKCTKCDSFYEVNILTGMCELMTEGCNDIDDCEKQKQFQEKIENGVKYANQAAGTLQFALIFTSVTNTPMFWYWAQSYQHIGNYDVYENEFKSYGLGPIYLRSFYKSYNVFPYLPQAKIFKQNENNQVVNLLQNNNLKTQRLLLKKQDLNWDSGIQQSLFNNLIYWSYMMIFIFLIFVLMRFIHQKNIIIYNIYIKKEEYVIRFIFFTSNYILMQMSLAFQDYKWTGKANTEDIIGFFISFFFIACYLYSLFRLYKQAISNGQEKQEFVSLFDRYLIKVKRRYKYFWLIFEIRKIIIVFAFCIPKYFLISSVIVLSLNAIFLIYLIIFNPFTDRYTTISSIFQEVSKVIIDIMLLLCHELTEFKSSICFSVVILLMFLNFINLMFVVFIIIKKILEYIKNRKNLKNDITQQDLSLLNFTDLIQGQTKRTNLTEFEKNSSIYSKANLIDYSRVSLSPFKIEQMKQIKYKNVRTSYTQFTKSYQNKTFEKI